MKESCLIVVDECHHTTGSSPYAQIFKNHYHQLKEDFPQDWVNVFQFSTFPSSSNNGDRIPAMFIKNDGHFQVCFMLNGEHNQCSLFPFDLETWYKIGIKQYKSCGSYWYDILIDDAVKYRMQNLDPTNSNGLL